MVMTAATSDDIEQLLVEGRMRCANCQGRLRPWGYARERVIRHGGLEARVRPRRTRCTECLATHVLLPSTTLLRHRDSTATIQAALVAHANGAGYRLVAAQHRVPMSTARGWLRRFRSIELAELANRPPTAGAAGLQACNTS